jgi:serine phosphatase RsbU (regulator of sigma subunit)
MVESCLPAAAEMDVAERAEIAVAARACRRVSAAQGAPPCTLAHDDAGVAMTDGGPVSSATAEPARGPEADELPGGARSVVRQESGWPYWPAVGVGILGLVVLGLLVWVAASTYNSNENRLLELRVRDAGALIAELLPSVQTPLASAAALADASGGDVQKFRSFVTPYVPRQYASVSLWRLGTAHPMPLSVVGAAPVLATSPTRAAAFFAQAARSAQLAMIGFLHGPRPRLGYAFTSPGLTGHFVAYAESALPANRRSKLQGSSAFADLHYALYLGRTQDTSQLVLTDLTSLPIRARHASVTIPFGNSAFTFVVTPKHPLDGTFAQRLPWAIAIIGVLISLGAAALTARLLVRRDQAERLARSLERVAEENRRLYAQQRTIAQTLQHALLPDRLPKIPGVETAARYEAGVEGVEVGGDWYDLIGLDDRRLLLVVGDVSGRGLRAASTMAQLRFAIHAYAAQGDPPGVILSKLSRLISVNRSGQLATILCALVEVETRNVTVTSAGHLPPLLISDGSGEFIQSEVGVPIGVSARARYVSTAVAAPPAATLLAFTDGLVERRGESIDAGLARLARAATSHPAALDELLDRLVEDLRTGHGDDDTAIAGLRWTD